MGKNTGDDHRKGSVDDRTQFETSSGNSAKRDTETGQILDVKSDKEKFKGVAEEKDDRRSESE